MYQSVSCHYHIRTSMLDWVRWFSNATSSSFCMHSHEVTSDISSKFGQFSNRFWTLFIVKIFESATLNTRIFFQFEIFCAMTRSEIPVDVPHSKISKFLAVNLKILSIKFSLHLEIMINCLNWRFGKRFIDSWVVSWIEQFCNSKLCNKGQNWNISRMAPERVSCSTWTSLSWSNCVPNRWRNFLCRSPPHVFNTWRFGNWRLSSETKWYILLK